MSVLVINAQKVKTRVKTKIIFAKFSFNTFIPGGCGGSVGGCGGSVVERQAAIPVITGSNPNPGQSLQYQKISWVL